MIICGATAYPRLIDFAAFREIADEVGAILMVDAAHFIGLVAGQAIPSPVPYADVVTFTTHKVLRGPRGGMILCREEHAAKIDKAVFPFLQGGPLMHARRRQGGRAQGVRAAGLPDLRRGRSSPTPRRSPAALEAEGMRPVSGGTDTHLALIDLRGVGVTGTEAEARCDAARHHAEQERDPVRPAAADGRLRHPGRHAERHHPGHGPGADGGGRQPHRPRGPRRRRLGGGRDRRRGLRADLEVPRLPPRLTDPAPGRA